jgi:hypothetical protein
MPANNDYPVLDGIAPSWADIIVKATPNGAALIEMKDISAINSGVTVEVGEQKAGGRVMKTTTGEVSYEASITFYREGYQKFLRGLAAASDAGSRGDQSLYSLAHFNVQVQHTPPGSTEIYEYRLKGCRALGRSLNGAEGTDADTVEVTLHVKEIVDVIDGKEQVAL